MGSGWVSKRLIFIYRFKQKQRMMAERTLSIYIGEKDKDLLDWIDSHPTFQPSHFFRAELKRHIRTPTTSPSLLLNIVICVVLSLSLIIGAWSIWFITDMVRMIMFFIGLSVLLISSWVILREKRRMRHYA